MGSEGAGPGQFDGLCGVAVDRQGDVYEVESVNNRVQKLSPDDELLAQWGAKGTDPGQLSSPHGVAVDV